MENALLAGKQAKRKLVRQMRWNWLRWRLLFHEEDVGKPEPEEGHGESVVVAEGDREREQHKNAEVDVHADPWAWLNPRESGITGDVGWRDIVKAWPMGGHVLESVEEHQEAEFDAEIDPLHDADRHKDPLVCGGPLCLRGFGAHGRSSSSIDTGRLIG